jgi:hypothetical protein
MSVFILDNPDLWRNIVKTKIVFLLTLCILALSLSACQIVRGSGEVITIERPVSDFDRVALSGIGTLYISVGEEESLKIEAEENLIPYIETLVRGQTLSIGFRDQGLSTAFQPTEPIRYYLTVKDLAGLDLSGAGNIEVDEIATSELHIKTSGAGNIEIEKLTAKVLNMDVSGAGSCHINEGQVTDQNLRISGAGGYKAPDLHSQTAEIDISGLGGARVWVEEDLRVEISGAGSVTYFGTPNLSQDVSGAGSIQSLGVKQ